MYCEVSDVQVLFPSSISVGEQNFGTRQTGASKLNNDVFTEDDIINFIRIAQQTIDSRLKPIYVTPLRRIKNYETAILNNLSAGQNISVSVHDTGSFAKGQTVRVQNNSNYESATVSSITNANQMVLANLTRSYDADSTISVLEYPDPIPFITSRLAASIGIDRLFVAQQSPDISNYGIELKRMGMNALYTLLDGTAILGGQNHKGPRFCRQSIYDSYRSQIPDINFGRENS